MSNLSAEWVSAIAEGIAALLSSVAVIVAVYVARQTSKQTEKIALEEARRDMRVFYAERKTEFREQCRAILAASNTIKSLLNPRMSELLSTASGKADEKTVRTYLAQLHADVNLLTAMTDSSSGLPSSAAQTVRDFLEEAAWVYADSLHLAILAFDSSDNNKWGGRDLRSPQEVVDELLNGSAVNLESRLLPGYDPNSPNGEGADSLSVWEETYERRKVLLLASDIVTGQPLPSSLAEVAARSLGWVSMRRFADLSNQLISCWGTGGEVEFRFNV